jgi:hypothetical protein
MMEFHGRDHDEAVPVRLIESRCYRRVLRRGNNTLDRHTVDTGILKCKRVNADNLEGSYGRWPERDDFRFGRLTAPRRQERIEPCSVQEKYKGVADDSVTDHEHLSVRVLSDHVVTKCRCRLFISKQ